MTVDNRGKWANGLAPNIPAMEANIARKIGPPRPNTIGDEQRMKRQEFRQFKRTMRRQQKAMRPRPRPGRVTNDV
jgi:hypothetical protein